ncbi:VapE domain-containing protein, partial [Roseofilum sp. Guam]|uniref:VapE domain-containing protein n=1 Tax=Roseofilum sp. Guam TaxID=2821502 RepID=UPI001B15F589
CVKGRPVYIALDADFRKNPSVKRQMKALGEALEKRGCDVRMCVWQYTKKTKGMDDFILNGGNFDEVIKTALTIAQWENQFNNYTQESGAAKEGKKESGGNRLSPIQKAEKAIESLSLPLKFNELSREVETAPGEEPDADGLWVKGCKQPGVYTSSDVFYRVLVAEAKKNSYHPVRNYLKGVHREHGDNISILNGAANRYFGTEDPFHQTLFTKYLIGSVARAMTPGCKMDTALILYGGQGIGKSTFFNLLFGDDWFTDSVDKLDNSNKDEMLKAHQCWGIELGEIENAFSKVHISKIKASMTATSDKIRPPYGRKTETWKRGFVVCGTTNNKEFLNDPTGSRRFWIIPCPDDIDCEALSQERDRLWAAAYDLWAKGEKWWLTEAEGRALVINNAEFESEDPWVEQLTEYLVKNGETKGTTVKGCLGHLNVDPSKQTYKEKYRVEVCLMKMGYERGRFYSQGKRVRGWVPIPLEKQSQGKVENQVSHVSHSPQTHIQQGIDHGTAPGQTGTASVPQNSPMKKNGTASVPQCPVNVPSQTQSGHSLEANGTDGTPKNKLSDENDQPEKTEPLSDPWGSAPTTEKSVSNDFIPPPWGCPGMKVKIKDLDDGVENEGMLIRLLDNGGWTVFWENTKVVSDHSQEELSPLSDGDNPNVHQESQEPSNETAQPDSSTTQSEVSADDPFTQEVREPISVATKTEDDLPYSLGELLWVKHSEGKLPAIITGLPDESGKWECKYLFRLRWRTDRFEPDGLEKRPSGNYSIDDKVLTVTPGTECTEAIITGSQDDEGEWEVMINLDGKWHEGYRYPPEELRPR